MSSPLIPVKASAKIPMEDSCNCCDKFTCNFFCCVKRPKSPTPNEEKKVEKIDKVAKETIQKKEGTNDSGNN
jgi:hypothetical protein